MLGFGPLDILELAQPHAHPRRGIAALDGVRRVRAGLARGIDQGLGAIEGFIEAEHGGWNPGLWRNDPAL